MGCSSCSTISWSRPSDCDRVLRRFAHRSDRCAGDRSRQGPEAIHRIVTGRGSECVCTRVRRRETISKANLAVVALRDRMGRPTQLFAVAQRRCRDRLSSIRSLLRLRQPEAHPKR